MASSKVQDNEKFWNCVCLINHTIQWQFKKTTKWWFQWKLSPFFLDIKWGQNLEILKFVWLFSYNFGLEKWLSMIWKIIKFHFSLNSSQSCTLQGRQGQFLAGKATTVVATSAVRCFLFCKIQARPKPCCLGALSAVAALL